MVALATFFALSSYKLTEQIGLIYFLLVTYQNSQMRVFISFFLLISLLLGTVVLTQAQITTATIYGNISDGDGKPLFNATVVAEHLPSGTQYGTTTLENGRYNLPNLRIGGPYKLSSSYVGYTMESVDSIYLAIGQKEQINLNLKITDAALDEVVIVADANAVINRERTGAAKNIDDLELRKMPTISRNTADFYRLTPAASGNSFLGRNDQFNNFSLDGSIFNNPFGLDAATPGGQTNAAPIPLDAIEQVQVSLSPFDVTQAGFTGASVNTVTKSGTNEFHGSAFVVYRNQNMTGGKIEGEDIFVPDLTQLQTGAMLGGPLIKNKLFFNAAFELQRREDLGANFVADNGQTGSNVSRVLQSDLDMVRTTLMDEFGYDTGAYEGFLHATDNQKGIIKLDYNANQNHTFSFKYNFLVASKDNPAHPSALGRRGPDATTLQFQNSGYQINNNIHSGILEWRGLFGNKWANKFQAGLTAFRDFRNAFSSPFPVVNLSKNGIRYIVAGHEPFSINNVLDQDVLQLTNNLNYYAGEHTITIGASLERFAFNNSFNLGVYGGSAFAPDVDINVFQDSIASGYYAGLAAAAEATYNANNTGDNWALAETNVGQFAVYLQDEWEVNNQFTLTAGVRVDVPLYFDTPEKIQENIDRQCCYFPDIEYFDVDGNEVFFDHTVLPKQRPLFSPRIGFNYDLTGDKASQLRGGTGLFTGRFPFVWVGNQVANPNFFFYNMTDPNFRFPQAWKTNIGFDQKFANDLIFTTDVIYTKDIYSQLVRNYGLKAPSGTLAGVDNRPIYTEADKNSFANNAYVFTNSNLGNSFNLTLELKKQWSRDFFTGISYNFNDTKDVSSIEAEISSDAYDRNPAFGNVNEAVLAHSIYGNRHRIVANGYRTFKYGGGKFATTVAAFFEAAQGGRFSYTYSGDLNSDGSGLNDLIYVPTTAEVDQMTFASDGQAAALESFIQQDEYLSSRRGEYAEKYAILSPWYTNLDLRILQDFKVGGSAFQLSLDLLNALNLVNSNWGLRRIPTNSQPIGIQGFNADGSPIYSFDTSLSNTFTIDPSLSSRWQAQIGLRWLF